MGRYTTIEMGRKNKDTYKRLEGLIEEFSCLYEVSKSITSTLRLDEVLNLITNKAAYIMKARACALRLLHGNKRDLILKASFGRKRGTHLLKENIGVGDSVEGRAVKRKSPFLVDDLLKVHNFKFSRLAKKDGLRSLLAVPLIERNITLGTLSVYSEKPGRYGQRDAQLLSMFASQAAIAIVNARLFEQTHTNYINTVKILANALDAKDAYTHGHSERVAQHVEKIAQALNLPEEEKEAIKYASYLHDLGKISVDNLILGKPGKLTKKEWREIVKHPKVGANILEKIGFLNHLVPIILHHHARCAGGGYPNSKLRGSKIPLGSRILAVADAYEAMISKRPYREALSKQEAIAELKRYSGTQFDPQIVKVFLKILNKNGPSGCFLE